MHQGRERFDARRGGCAYVLALAIALTVAGAADAEDGVVEINQARAAAGGVTAGDAPGFPVTIAAPGSYRLTGNLDLREEAAPADVTAISITASHVTLDLNGFAILGATGCSGPPPTCDPIGAGRGIDASSVSNVTVSDGSVHGMGSDGLRLGLHAVVRNVMVGENAGAGIHVGEFSLVMEAVVWLNGAGVEAGSGSVVIGNAASYNGSGGLALQQGSVAQANATSFNFADGIAAGGGSVVRGNASYSNGGHGLSLTNRSGFAGNVLVDNDDGTVLSGVEMGADLCASDTACP